MTPEDATREAKGGKLRPVYLVVGDEHFLVSLVVEALRKATLGGMDLGLNADDFEAGTVDAVTVCSAASTLPMMAPKRFVLVRGVERWEPKGDPSAADQSGGKSDGERKRTPPLDRIVEYAESPSPSTTLVLVAGKLDARRRLSLLAKKEDFIVDCVAPPRNAVPAWLSRRAKERNKKLSPGVGELLAEIAGPELARLDDAIERLSLFVGDAEEIGEAAVSECIAGVRVASVFELTSAVARKDLGAALSTFASVFDSRDRGLPLLGTLSWSARQLTKFQGATARGLSPQDAAKAAGAPPFKAAELAAQTKLIQPAELDLWLRTLAEADLDLKGGSRRSPEAILTAALIRLCGRRAAHKAPVESKPIRA